MVTKGVDRGRSDRVWGLNQLRRGSNLRARYWAASAVLVLAASVAACGDSSKPAATEDMQGTTSTPTSSAPPATTAPATPAPGDGQNAPAPASAASPEEGQGNRPTPIAPAGTDGQGSAAPSSNTTPAGSDAQTPPAMEMPPASDAEKPAAFSPCPTDGSACKIMPLGDSITFGLQSSTGGGYRIELLRKAVADKHPITFVGRQMSGPNTLDGQPFPKNNEGYSGATIATGGNQLANRLDAAFAANTPNIVLLHIGTNNLYQGLAPGVTDQLGALIDQIVKDAPDALVVVAQITPLGSATNGVQPYNAAIPAIVQQRVDAGKHLLLVNMFGAFTTANANVSALLADGVHPNDTGYGIMAQTWYDAIQSLLP